MLCYVGFIFNECDFFSGGKDDWSESAQQSVSVDG